MSANRKANTPLIWEQVEEPQVNFDEFVKLFAKSVVKEKKKPISDTISKSKTSKQVSLFTIPFICLFCIEVQAIKHLKSLLFCVE